jgi:uncharacterized coiled-coil protein SlyX
MMIQVKDWHLEKKVTLGLIIALLVNIGSSVWWASALNSQVMAQQKTLDSQSQQINAIITAQANVGERLAKMESAIGYQTKSLDRIEESLRKK